MRDINTSQYLVCHHRKGNVFRVFASDYGSAKRVMQDMHHMNSSMLPETFLYVRDDGDWSLLHWFAYELRDGRAATVRHK